MRDVAPTGVDCVPACAGKGRVPVSDSLRPGAPFTLAEPGHVVSAYVASILLRITTCVQVQSFDRTCQHL